MSERGSPVDPDKSPVEDRIAMRNAMEGLRARWPEIVVACKNIAFSTDGVDLRPSFKRPDKNAVLGVVEYRIIVGPKFADGIGVQLDKGMTSAGSQYSFYWEANNQRKWRIYSITPVITQGHYSGPASGLAQSYISGGIPLSGIDFASSGGGKPDEQTLKDIAESAEPFDKEVKRAFSWLGRRKNKRP